jgi:hypothetical protein
MGGKGIAHTTDFGRKGWQCFLTYQKWRTRMQLDGGVLSAAREMYRCPANNGVAAEYAARWC